MALEKGIAMGAVSPSGTDSAPRVVRWTWSKARRIDIFGVLGVLAIFIVWEVVTALELVRPLFLPAPADVWGFLTSNFFSSPLIQAQSLGEGGIWGSVMYSSVGVWGAVAIATLIGLPLGLLSARSVGVRMFSDPLLLTVSGMPILIMAPFFMVWFGPARTTQLLLLIVFCTPVVYIYAQRAVDNLSSVYESNARLFGASRGRVIRDVYIRGTLPEVMGGMRIALAGSWGLAAISELMGAPQGVGKLIVGFASNTNVVAIWAVVLCFSAIAVLTDFALAALMRFLNRWVA